METVETKWLERAKKYRAAAARSSDSKTRRIYEELADNCERIAGHKQDLTQRGKPANDD